MRIKDSDIRGWIKSGDRFEGRSVGNNLYLRFRITDRSPKWRYRYSLKGHSRVIDIGSFEKINRQQADAIARTLAAKIALGHDVAGEKQTVKRAAVDKIIGRRDAANFSQLAIDYYERKIKDRVKHPEIVRRLIINHLNPYLGHLLAKEVTPHHIDLLLIGLARKNHPSTSNKALRLTKKIFDHGLRLQVVASNPAAPFTTSDAGGKEQARDRNLSPDELAVLFDAMRRTPALGRENYLAICLLLCLAVRKMELIGASWREIDFTKGEWTLPAERTKTSQSIVIPLAPEVSAWLLELKQLSAGSEWIFPARKAQIRLLPHISESTLSAALGKVKSGLPHFTIHDLRRTARSLLAHLKVSEHTANRCLNHRIKGTAGRYDRYHYFDARQQALGALATFIHAIESGGAYEAARNT